jgi:hypothetical protein
MIAFIVENLATILVGAVVLAVIVLIILKMRRDKKRGAGSCGCSCEGCSSSVSCHKNEK